MFWDRANHPIHDVIEWAKLFEDAGYRLVALDIEGDVRISTIWQGINLYPTFLPDAVPSIFETMAFRHDDALERMFWPSEWSALEGHSMLCQAMLGRPARPEDGHLARAIEGQKRR